MTQNVTRTLKRLMNEVGGVSTHGGVVLDRKTRRIMAMREAIAAEQARKKEEQ